MELLLPARWALAINIQGAIPLKTLSFKKFLAASSAALLLAGTMPAALAQEIPPDGPATETPAAAPEPLPEGPIPPVAPALREVPLPPPVVLPPPSGAEIEPEAAALQPLTAAEAAAIALRRQPEIEAARANLTIAGGRTRRAAAAGLPSLGIGSSYSTSRTGGAAAGADAASGLRVNATAQQLLLDFGRTRSAVAQARALERAARADLTARQADVVLEVKQSFYTLVQNERLVEVNESNLRNRQEQLNLAQARLQAGLGAPVDAVRAQTAVAEAAFLLESARNAASTARVNLARLMGIDPRTPVQTAPSAEPEPAAMEVNALTTAALRVRPEMIAAHENLQAAGAGVKAARATNAPALSAQVGASSRGDNFSSDSRTVSAGLVLQWSPIDGGRRAGEVREAQGVVQRAQAEMESLRLQVIAEVAQAYLDLGTAEQRLTAAAAQEANAEEGARLAQGRYAAGAGTFIEVIDAQASLLSARTNRVNALSARDQARARLRRASGDGLPQ